MGKRINGDQSCNRCDYTNILLSVWKVHFCWHMWGESRNGGGGVASAYNDSKINVHSSPTFIPSLHWSLVLLLWCFIYSVIRCQLWLLRDCGRWLLLRQASLWCVSELGGRSHLFNLRDTQFMQIVWFCTTTGESCNLFTVCTQGG